MNTVLYWAASFALVCFALGMVLAAVRLLRGPTAQDRVLALDTLYINGMLTMLVFGIRSGTSVYFDIALLIALFGFVGSTAMARFLLRGGDRAMIESQIPLWAGIPASILLVLGGLLALTGSAGLLRFRSLLCPHPRAHARQYAGLRLRAGIFHAGVLGAVVAAGVPRGHHHAAADRVLAGHRHAADARRDLSRQPEAGRRGQGRPIGRGTK